MRRMYQQLLVVVIGLLLITIAAGCSATHRSQTAAAQATEDPSIVAVVGSDPVTLDEFERRYLRTEGTWAQAKNDSLAAYRDFLDQYVNYRLKVQAAKEAGYDADPDVRSELDRYGSAFARPFLLDKEVLEPLVRDYYTKSQEFVDVSHILLRLPPDAAPEDTLQAYRRMQSLMDSLESGTPFGDLAYRYSDDPTASRREGARGYRGHMGLLGAGKTLKPFEDAAYATPVGEVSGIVRTQYGYHLIKVHDRMPARPDVKVAHIMIQPATAAPEDTLATYDRLVSLKDSLANGASFAALARRHSDDSQTAGNGGQFDQYLDYTMNFPPSFKEAAFSLKEEGAVSDVVRTRYGYHLIKLIDRKELGTYTEAYNRLKQRIKELPRYQRSLDRLAQRLRDRYEVRLDTTLVSSLNEAAPPDSLRRKLLEGTYPGTSADAVLAAVGDSSYSLADFSVYLRSQNPQRRPRQQDTNGWSLNDSVEQFVDKVVVDYEAARLRTTSTAYQKKMREFADGLLTFELMRDSVWDAAARDTARLKAYYEAHRNAYRYPTRRRVLRLLTPSDTLLSYVGRKLDAGASVSEIKASLPAEKARHLYLDTLMVSKETGTITDRALRLAEGERSRVLPYNEGRGQIIFVNMEQLPARQKTFEEALPQVTTDYREVLEQELIARLRQKYRVKTYPGRLSRAFQEEQAVRPPSSASLQ